MPKVQVWIITWMVLPFPEAEMQNKFRDGERCTYFGHIEVEVPVSSLGREEESGHDNSNLSKSNSRKADSTIHAF